MADQDITFKIRTTADLKAAESAKASLDKTITAAKAMGRDTTALDAASSALARTLEGEAASLVRLNSGLESAIKNTKQLGGDTTALRNQVAGNRARINDLNAPTGKQTIGDRFRELKGFYDGAGGGANGIAAAVTSGTKLVPVLGAIAGAALGAKRAIDEYANAEEAIRELDNAMARQGQLTDANREKYQALAQTLQRTTAIAGGEWTAVLTKLTQFGSKSADIERDADAVKNFAGIIGGDLNTAATAISKAMQGNFDMFQRYGIVLDENATKAQKLEELYRQLADRGGGMLEARAESLNGQFKKLRNSISDFFEVIGQKIAGSGKLQVVLYGLAESVGWVAKVMGTTIPKAEGLENSFKRTTESALEGEEANKRYTKTLEAQKEASDKASRAADTLKNKIRDAARSAIELEDAKLAEQLAQIDAAETRGKLGPVQAVRARQNATNASKKRKFDIQNEADQETIKADLGAVDKAVDDVTAKDAAIQEAEKEKKRVEQLDAMRAELARVESVKKNLESDSARLLKRQAFLGRQEDLPANHPNAIPQDIADKLAQNRSTVAGYDLKAQNLRDKLKAESLRDVKGEQVVEEKSPEDIARDIEALKKQKEAAQKRLEEVREKRMPDIEATRRQMDTRRDVFAIETRAEAVKDRTEVFKTTRETAKKREDTTSKKQDAIIDGAKERGETGQGVRTIQQTGNKLSAAMKLTAETTVEQFEAILQIMQKQAAENRLLKQQFEQLKAQQANARTP